MPSVYKRKFPRRANVDQPLTVDQKYDLCYGRGLLSGYKPMGLDMFKAMWARHGEKLLADFVAEHLGRRPFGWWVLVHQRERPVNPDVPRWEVESRRRAARFGFLFGNILGKFAGEWQWMLETESDYLRRIGELTAAELRIIDGIDDS